MRVWIGLIMVLFLAASVMAVPITVEKVEVDDVHLNVNANNRLDLERGDTVDVDVLVTAMQDTEVEVEAFISGFEYNDVTPLAARTQLFTLDANETKKLTLPLHIDEEVQEDNYKLRLLITDRDGEAILQNYNLKLDVPRHDLNIEDVVTTPSGTVMAGQAVLATVRVENQGEKDEDDVKVEFGIPALQLRGTDYIDRIDSDDEEETEEIFLRVPLCAEAGTYDAETVVTFDEGHRTERALSKVRVEENPQCAAMQAQMNDDQVDVVVEAQAQPLEDEQPKEPTTTARDRVRKALETLVIILVGLLVIIALVIGYNKLRQDDDEEY